MTQTTIQVRMIDGTTLSPTFNASIEDVTLADLKFKIRQLLPPAQQSNEMRLLHMGRFLGGNERDTEKLAALGLNTSSVLHLVVREPGLPSEPQAETAGATSTPRSTTSSPSRDPADRAAVLQRRAMSDLARLEAALHLPTIVISNFAPSLPSLIRRISAIHTHLTHRELIPISTLLEVSSSLSAQAREQLHSRMVAVAGHCRSLSRLLEYLATNLANSGGNSSASAQGGPNTNAEPHVFQNVGGTIGNILSQMAGAVMSEIRIPPSAGVQGVHQHMHSRRTSPQRSTGTSPIRTAHSTGAGVSGSRTTSPSRSTQPTANAASPSASGSTPVIKTEPAKVNETEQKLKSEIEQSASRAGVDVPLPATLPQDLVESYADLQSKR